MAFIDDWRNNKLTMEMQALNVAVSSFATWQACEANPMWIMAKNKAFRSVSVYSFILNFNIYLFTVLMALAMILLRLTWVD